MPNGDGFLQSPRNLVTRRRPEEAEPVRVTVLTFLRAKLLNAALQQDRGDGSAVTWTVPNAVNLRDMWCL
jgi:hypothetical protein